MGDTGKLGRYVIARAPAINVPGFDVAAERHSYDTHRGVVARHLRIAVNRFSRSGRGKIIISVCFHIEEWFVGIFCLERRWSGGLLDSGGDGIKLVRRMLITLLSFRCRTSPLHRLGNPRLYKGLERLQIDQSDAPTRPRFEYDRGPDEMGTHIILQQSDRKTAAFSCLPVITPPGLACIRHAQALANTD